MDSRFGKKVKKKFEIIELPRFLDARGNLSFAENFKQVPFEIKRVYWLYDVPGGEKRDGHAYKENQEFIIAMSGSFDVAIDDGIEKKTFTLNRSYYGLYIPKGLWRELDNFSTNAVALILSSTHYNPQDYVYDYDEFLNMTDVVTNGQSGQDLYDMQHHRLHSVMDCSMIEFDQHHSKRKGNLTVVDNGITLPINIKRIYYIYDVPGGESRGAHAHKELSQLIIAVSGSFSVVLDDGSCKRTFFLNRPYQALYVKPGIWRDITDFSSGAVCMVLASEVYKECDYIRSYNEFLEFRGIGKE